MTQTPLSRRSLLQTLGIGSAAIAAAGVGLAGLHPIEEAEAAGISTADANILNFALNLEYLEAEFYAYATTGAGLPAEFLSGRGTEGATTGGTATTFTDSVLQATAVELAADELNHVKYIRSLLGSRAVGKPAINLAPLGSFATQSAFLTYARAFEDTGVSAYTGAAPLIRNKTVLLAAARILAAEAYHAGNIRLHVVDAEVMVNALDSKDQIPTTTNQFPLTSRGFSLSRTVSQVLNIVEPFFPNGLNGRIR